MVEEDIDAIEHIIRKLLTDEEKEELFYRFKVDK